MVLEKNALITIYNREILRGQSKFYLIHSSYELSFSMGPILRKKGRGFSMKSEFFVIVFDIFENVLTTILINFFSCQLMVDNIALGGRPRIFSF